MNVSFLTGSRVYGTPRPDSDIDLVVLVDGKQLQLLADASDRRGDFGSPGDEHYDDGFSLRFGRLNLLCVTQQKHFDIWRDGTNELIDMKPVTREFAIEFLANKRRVAKISGW